MNKLLTFGYKKSIYILIKHKSSFLNLFIQTQMPRNHA